MDRIEVVKSYMQVDISMAKENNSHASSTREKYVYVYLDDADLLLTALASKDRYKAALEEIASAPCICEPCYKDRGLIQPDCCYCHVAIIATDALKEGGE